VSRPRCPPAVASGEKHKDRAAHGNQKHRDAKHNGYGQFSSNRFLEDLMLDQMMLDRRLPCFHQPRCPSAADSAHGAARVVAAHPEQGWVLLCNGVVVFDDTGEILPDGRAVAPQRSAYPNRRPPAEAA